MSLLQGTIIHILLMSIIYDKTQWHRTKDSSLKHQQILWSSCNKVIAVRFVQCLWQQIQSDMIILYYERTKLSCNDKLSRHSDKIFFSWYCLQNFFQVCLREQRDDGKSNASSNQLYFISVYSCLVPPWKSLKDA